MNPLVEAANPLLNALSGIRNLPANIDTSQLRQQLIDAVRRFEVRGQNAQIPYDTLIAARYCLCTVIDEAASLTQWGRDGVWPRSGLLVTFHNETWGGEKFFQMLAQLSQDPKENLYLLELLSFCLLLGFEGRYRIVDNGASQLETLKQRLVQLIRSVRGPYPQPLSAMSFDAAAAPRPWRPMMPMWAFALCLLLMAGLCFVAFRWRLGHNAGPVLASIDRLELPALSLQPAQPKVTDVMTLKMHLRPEIEKGYLNVDEANGRATVTLRGDLLFSSGSDSLRPAHHTMMRRIAEALNQVVGQVLVLGYSDSDRMTSKRFASNEALSLARAITVGTMLREFLIETDRVQTEGRGEANPVAPNDSAANKALNRRVEIILMPTTNPPRSARPEEPDHA